MATGKLAILATTATCAVLVASYVFTEIFRPQNDFASCTEGSVAGGAIGGPFELLDENGNFRTEQDVITKPTLIYFGYSFCPDVCPFDVARNATAIDILSDNNLDVGSVFISVDPERDTPQFAAEYAQAHHPDMIGLSGSPEQIAKVTRAYKVYYKKQPSDDPDFYIMDHSTFTYFMMPEHGFVDFFRNDVSPDNLAERISCFMNAAS